MITPNKRVLLVYQPGMSALSLSGNYIAEISVDAFKHVANLQELCLSWNQLDHLPKDVFRGLSNLKMLDLTRNHFSANITWYI